MKRFAICMDGTWQQLNQPRATNINLIARSIAHQAGDVPQIVIYTPGVGSTLNALKGRQTAVSAFNTWLTSTIGGIFGEGLEDAILDTYLRLAFNYEPGDEIYIFGFSRGAFSARSLAAMIGKCGIVRRRFAVKAGDAFRLYRDASIKPDSPEAVEFRTQFGKRLGKGTGRHNADYRPPIAYLGIFDTVGQRGLPSMLGPLSAMRNKRYAFHDTSLGSHVAAARHALAIDERRAAFPPTLWDNFDVLNQPARAAGQPDPYQQRWFVGGHGDVGGGNPSTLSNFSLEWMVEGAERAGLAFDRTDQSPLTITLTGDGALNPAAPITAPSLVRMAVPINWNGPWRKIPVGADVEIDRTVCESALHQSVAMRTVSRLKRPYAPAPLKPFKSALQEIAAPPALMYTLVDVLKPKPRKKFLGLF
ncbi:MAG: DUF2235 domain-containing protein [Hyphomonadaceae bacterium]|nr:DUF2235 domain-containing protein [Hyphomonadaceae bacterium]